MFYNIFLERLPNIKQIGQEQWIECKSILKKLACENYDLIESQTFPAIICRYATETELEFYKALETKYQFKIMISKVNKQENVFDLFDEDLIKNEQEEIHMMNKIQVEQKIKSGAKILADKETAQNEFLQVSKTIKEQIEKFEKEVNLKFSFKSGVGIILTCSFFAMMAFIIHLFKPSFLNLTAMIVFAVLQFVFGVSTCLLFDFVHYKKLKNIYTSKDHFSNFINYLHEQNKYKNKQIHMVEDFVDSLTARNSLNVLPTSKRNLNDCNLILKELKTKSINQVFSIN